MHDIVVHWGERSARLSPDQAIMIGSDPSSTLVVPEARVAPQHVLLSFERDCWVARDQSGGRITVEGRIMPAVRVERALQVRLGPPDGPALRLEPMVAEDEPTTALRGPAPVVSADAPARVHDAARTSEIHIDLGHSAPGHETVMITDQSLRLAFGDRERVFQPGQTAVVGRDADCDLRHESRLVSRRHCRFTHDGTGWSIEDLDSSRGTFIDHRRVKRKTKIEGAFFAVLGDDDAGEKLRVITAGEHLVRRPRAPLLLGAAGLVLGAAALLLVLVNQGDDGPEPVAQPLETVVVEATPDPAEVTVAADAIAPSIVQPVLTFPNGETCSSGSGTYVGDGLILTNFHVVGVLPGPGAECRFRGDVAVAPSPDRPAVVSATATIVAIDPAADLAVLRIGGGFDPPAVPLSMETPAIGSRLRIFGYPGIGGATLTVTSGEVSGFLDDANVGPGAWIKTDATVAGGNSGGAAINDRGELVGVPTIVGASGTTQTVECRPLADTNGNGQLDGADTCVSVGGFLNGVRPARLAEELISTARTAEPFSFDDPSLDLNAVDANADFDEIAVDGLRLDGFDRSGERVDLDGSVEVLCATFSFSGIDQGLWFTSVWARNDDVLPEGYSEGFWGAGPENETTNCYRPLGGVVAGDYFYGIAFGLDFDVTFQVEERVG